MMIDKGLNPAETSIVSMMQYCQSAPGVYADLQEYAEDGSSTADDDQWWGEEDST